MYHKSVTETQGRGASLLSVKMVGNDWTDEETPCFLQVIKVKSMRTIFVSKQTRAVGQDLMNCNAKAAVDSEHSKVNTMPVERGIKLLVFS